MSETDFAAVAATAALPNDPGDAGRGTPPTAVGTADDDGEELRLRCIRDLMHLKQSLDCYLLTVEGRRFVEYAKTLNLDWVCPEIGFDEPISSLVRLLKVAGYDEPWQQAGGTPPSKKYLELCVSKQLRPTSESGT